MSDLIKELKSYPEHYTAAHKAADRIEVLEAALRRIGQHDLQAIALDALHPDCRITLRENTSEG